ncbi:hypothetical protein Are01nite_07630 [Actinoplanes regularis]|nr:hypothetical protein Are01nite_07630 [Actinoplanes regularis]
MPPVKIVFAAAVTATLLLSGCGLTGDKPEGTPCERWLETQKQFMLGSRTAAPEAQEMRRAVQSKGKGEPLPEAERQKIWAAYYGAQATAYREIAEDTTDQKLHDAFIAMADDHQRAGDTFGIPAQNGLMDVLQICDIGTDENAGTPSAGA